MSVIRTQQLSRCYGQRVGIEQVSLDIQPGEIFGFLGPNGAGKSTTIRLLLGFLKPDAGQAEIFGKDCWNESARVKQDVGYLPGDLRLYPWLTTRRALRTFGKVRGKDLMARGEHLAARFELEMDVAVRKMSRGNRQKVGILLALAHEPQLVVLDEPTSGLDPLMQIELTQQLRTMAAQGHTVFFSSHSLSEVENLCDRVAIVRKGSIVADEHLDALRKRAHRIVELVYRDQSETSADRLPEFLKLIRTEGPLCECQLLGSTPELVRWAAEQPLVDISIGPPDLESVFHQYYQTENDSE